MGWSDANTIFDPVARKLISMTDESTVITEVLAVLINALQEGDWDTEDESLEEFPGNEAVVEAFRRNGVIIRCGEQFMVDGQLRWCERECLPRGHDDGKHEDWQHVTWPVAKQEA